MARLGFAGASVVALAACGTDVAQTAIRPGQRAVLDCRPSGAAVTLPSDPVLGGGDSRTTSPLVGGSYRAGQGPGIAVVARDGFRLYQNGELVADSTDSLVPVFVPLTFLPGENVVTVVVSSPDRAPALLVHVDELERPYVSDASWKVTTTPDGDYRRPGYDASGWDDAVDHGEANEIPGCEPPAGFVSGSAARWIGAPDENARTAVFRLAFSIAPVGFGASTTGGEGAVPVVAETLEELTELLDAAEPQIVLVPEGELDVRRTGADIETEEACTLPCNDGSGKDTYFALSSTQTCETAVVPIARCERRFDVRSNKTLVGLGRGAILRGAWLTASGADNVIVRNVAVYDVNPSIIEAGDGFSLEQATRIWLDHMTFRWIGDGFIDVTTGSDITLSWIRFDGDSDYACGAHHPRANELGDASATIHHSFYDHVTGRSPLVNRPLSQVHLFNDVFSDNPDYAVGAGCSAEILLQGSYFEGVRFPTLRRNCTDDTSVGLISAPEGSNDYDPATGPHQQSGADSPEPRDETFVPLYDYTLDPLNDVRNTVRVRAGAGSHWAQPFEIGPEPCQ